MFGQLFAAPSPGGDGNRACAERFSASNVARRIADNVDLVGGKFASMFLFRARAREFAKLVAVVMIVGERSEFKKMPDAVMTELQLRTTRDVACQETEDH